MSLTSPPEKSSRRVRFSLPEAKLTLNSDKRTLHGTSKYVNGTLINVTSTIHSANDLGKKNELNGAFKSSLKANGASIPGKETSQYKVSLNIRPTSVAAIKEQGRHSLPTTTSAGLVSRRRASKTITRGSDKSFNTLPIIERKSSSLEEFDEDSLDGDYRDDETKSKQHSNLTRYKSSDDLRDSCNFKARSSVLKLPDAPNGSSNYVLKRSSTSNTLKVPEYADNHGECATIAGAISRKLPATFLQTKFSVFSSSEASPAPCDKKNERLSDSQNSEQFFDFVDKWRANRLAGNKKIDDIFRNSSCEFPSVQATQKEKSTRERKTRSTPTTVHAFQLESHSPHFFSFPHFFPFLFSFCSQFKADAHSKTRIRKG